MTPAPMRVEGGQRVIARNVLRVGDRVTMHGCPFWLTVTGLLPNGYVACRFGSIGRDAGPGIHESQLQPIKQTEEA